MAPRKISERDHIAWPPPDMHGNDAAGLPGNQVGHSQWINGMRARIQVAKHRSNSVPAQGVGRSNKSKRRDDDFTRKTERLYNKFKANGSVTDGNAIFHLSQFADAVLKLLQQRSIVR